MRSFVISAVRFDDHGALEHALRLAEPAAEHVDSTEADERVQEVARRGIAQLFEQRRRSRVRAHGVGEPTPPVACRTACASQIGTQRNSRSSPLG